MVTRHLVCVGIFWFLGLVFSASGEEKDESDIPDKVGAEVHMSKQERKTLKKVECGMCKAVLREMHAEVVKHSMTSKGWGSESQVWETSNAMCLAMLQKYKLDLAKEKIEKKAEDEDENMGMAGGNPQLTMRGMLVLKMGCQRWLDDFGGDTTGFIYKRVKEGTGTPEASAKEFCYDVVNQCGKGKKDAAKKEKKNAEVREVKRRELRKKEDKQEEKAQEDNPFAKLPKDSMAGLQRMLEMAKDDPLHYMEEPAKLRIQQGVKELRCEVCRAALGQVLEDVMQRPKSMRAEFDILPFAEGACDGGPDKSVPSYFGIDPPSLAPVWADKFRPKLDKKSNKYILKGFPKKAGKKRAAWRKLTLTGAHKPPPPEEYEGDMMMQMSCKEVMEPARMVEVLYEQMGKCASSKEKACDAALSTAVLTCRSIDDAQCIYGSSGEKKEAPKKEEL